VKEKTDEELLQELRDQFTEWDETASGRLERFVWAFGTEPATLIPRQTRDVREVLDELYLTRDELERPKQLEQAENPEVLACFSLEVEDST
jgi:hypothetical protein